MPAIMGLEWFVRLVFILYCGTVGIILVVLPWTPEWSYLIASLPLGEIPWLQEPVPRGVLNGIISGFGLVHLVWVAHDVDHLLHREDMNG